MLGEDRVGGGRVELDAYDGLQVGARLEAPLDVERGPRPPLYRPEPLDGRLLRIIQRDYTPEQVTKDDLQQEQQRRAFGSGDQSYLRYLSQLMSHPGIPQTRAPFSRIVLDSLSWLWVLRNSNGLASMVPWDVFDSAGVFQCTLPLPASLRITEIGTDFLLGIVVDSTDEEQVRQYTVSR